MLSASTPTQTPPSGEDSSGSDRGSEVNVGAPATETDRFGFILGNGSTAGSEGPPPELVRQRETKWINIISQWDRVLLKKSSKVKEQCQKGIPASLRAKCWPLLCGATDRMRHNKDLYQTLDSRPALQSWVDVIERDLDRQFPFHEMFLSRDGHGQRGLFRVLKAFTQLKPEEGYCQAQGPVAAVLLMNMPTEQAFWCLVQISEEYLPGYYSPLLEGVLFDAALLTRVLKRTCPAAHKHLQRHGVEPLMFATDWLMCLFTRHLPFNTLLRVWDLFFCYGVRVLFQVAVVLVRRALGRVEQREACEGQMETLERLRGVREQVQQEDDTFIAEVCSVPLSSKDLERQTERELEKWRMERPASTFDPRGRCHGYQMAWARVREREEERNRKEREKGNLSLPLIRSPSLLSLSPSLLRKRWMRGSGTDIGEWEGEGREVRKVSEEVWEERSEGGNLRRRSEMDGSPVRAPGVPSPATEDRAPVETREPLEHKEPFEQEDRRQKTQLTPDSDGEPSQQRQLTSDHNVTSQGQGEEQGGLSQTPASEQHSDSQTQETTNQSKDTMQTQEVLDKQSTASANIITVHIVTETKGEAEKSKETETRAEAKTEEETAPDTELKTYTEEETAPHTELKTYTEEETAPHTELKTYTEEETAPDTELKTYTEEETAPDTELKTYTEEETAPDTELKTYTEAKTEEERVTETHTDVEVQIQAEAKTEEEMEAEVQKGQHTDKSVETETDMGSKETATQTDVNTDTETDTQQEAGVNLEAETDTGSLTESDKGTDTETHTDKEIQACSEIQSHKGTETHTDEKSEAERETTLEAHTEPETQEENESAMHIEADTRVEAETDLGSQIEAETQTDKESEIQVAVYIGIETRTEKATDTNTGIETNMESPHDIQRHTETAKTEVQYTEPSRIIPANQSQVSPELTSTTEPAEERDSSEQKLPEKPQSPVTIHPDQETQKVRESEGEKEKKASTDILPPLHQRESLTGDFPHIPDNPKSQSQSESPPPADSKADSGNSVSTQIDVSSQRTTPCDGPWATPSGDFRLCKSSSSRRLTRRLSEDLFTNPNQSQPTFTQSNQSNIGFIQSNQPQLTSPIQVPKHPESPKQVTGSNPDTIPPQTGPKSDKGPTDTPRLFGLFRRLKGEQPRQDREKGEHKVPIPQILIQDFSDGKGEGSTVRGEEEENLSSRERRRRRREQERREKEEEKLQKKREKELEKERKRERRKPQTRGKSFQVLHCSVPLPGNSGSQTFGSKRNSTPFMETYF